jgi:hypothetical protein
MLFERNVRSWQSGHPNLRQCNCFRKPIAAGVAPTRQGQDLRRRAWCRVRAIEPVPKGTPTGTFAREMIRSREYESLIPKSHGPDCYGQVP